MASPITTPPAHTPGPWHVAESENAAVYNGEKHWAILPNPETTHGQVIADIETIVPEADANARLIAQAPRFFRLAEELVGQWAAYVDDPDPITLRQWAEHVARWKEAIRLAAGR